MQGSNNNQIPIAILPLSDLYRLRAMLAMYKFFDDFLAPRNYKHRATIKIQKPFPKERLLNTLTDFIKHVRNERLAITSSKCLIDDYLMNLLREQLEKLDKQSEQPNYIHLKTDWTKCYVKTGYTFDSKPIHEYRLNSRISIIPWETVIECRYYFRVNARVEYLSARLMYKQVKQLDVLFEDSGLARKCNWDQLHRYSHQIERALVLLFKHRLLKIPVDIQLDKYYSHYHCKYNEQCEVKLTVELPIWLKIGKRYAHMHQTVRQYPKLNTRATTKILNKVKRFYLKWRADRRQKHSEHHLSPAQDLNYHKPMYNTEYPFRINENELFVIRSVAGLCE